MKDVMLQAIEQIVGRERRSGSRNLLGAAEGALNRAAASTQPFWRLAILKE